MSNKHLGFSVIESSDVRFFRLFSCDQHIF